ncbi:glycyl-trna synthetase/dna polymerase subunit gamma-2 [Holotrichia oblita]|nr:glycyl-trna synthetase/dna polymerase subunit gamma-2 [Holotrichia oblita]
MSNLTMEKLTALCKGRGFIFAGSEIYGGLANTWDYGPLGCELISNVKKAWWQKFVTEPENNYGVDCAILMNSSVWEASGHIGGFSDPLMDCKECKTRHRADQLAEDFIRRKKLDTNLTGWTDLQLSGFISEKAIPCPVCGKSNFTAIKKFNLMFKTFQGVTEDSANIVYMRPETAQGIFVNFQNIQRTTRAKIPFGVGQVGKCFRNEITPGNFIFRTREFEQMEMEFFCKPGTDLEWFEYWKSYCRDWLYGLGIKQENLRLRDHAKEELSHYSKATTDFEFLFPFGWGELWGIADRTDYDLTCHQTKSGKSMEYTDPVTNEKYVPYCVEPSLGVGRMALALLSNAYEEEIVDGETRVVLKLHPFIAPYKAAILPLQKNPELIEKAERLYKQLSKKFNCTFDGAGSIGKRYRRQDEIGTPYCITIDFDTLTDGAATVRDRDNMTQVRLPLDKIAEYVLKSLEY